MLESAREYLSRVVPWPEAGETAYVNIHYLTGTAAKTYFCGVAATSVDDAIDKIAWLRKWDKCRDIYVCMSLQSAIRTDSKPMNNAVRSQGNALRLRSLFVDIDLKGKYKTSVDAIRALGAFVTSSGMPKPATIVQSGSGGLHVYWTYERGISTDQWKLLSRALVECAKHHGFEIDAGCSIDAARVLRVPETFNYKSDPPAPVTLVKTGPTTTLADLTKVLGPYTPKSLPAPPQKIVLNAEIMGGLTREAAPISINQVAQECPFIRESLAAGGKDWDEPLWRQSLLIASFTTEGLEAAQRMSSGRGQRRYGNTPESVAQKYQEVLTQRELNNVGWPSCTTVETLNCTLCSTCVHKPAGKTPLHFALPTQVVPVNPGTPSDLPRGYFDRGGFIYKIEELGPEIPPREVRICNFRIEDGWLSKNPWTLHFKSEHGPGQPARVSIAVDKLAAKDQLAKELLRQGFEAQDNHCKYLREFFMSWMSTLKQRRERVLLSAPFGWFVNGSKVEGFSYAGKIMLDDGSEREAPNSDPVIEHAYAPVGELGPWHEASRMITDQGRPALDALLASAFAGPLVRFTGESGLLMSAYSPESGIGKSTTLKVASAVWGNPLTSVQTLNDTPNSVLNKMGQIRSLPLFWDELKGEKDTDKFITMAFSLGQGVEKSRLNASVEQRVRGTWEMLLVAASNNPLLDVIGSNTKATTAGIYRVFEFTVEPGTKGQIQTSDAARMTARLKENFGQAGLIYAKKLAEKHSKVADIVAQKQRALSITHQTSSDERFWIATMTVLLCGAQLANLLSLTKIDEQALENFLVKTLKALRSERDAKPNDITNAANVGEILATYLDFARTKHTIVTDKLHFGRGRPSAGSVQIKNDITKLDGVHVHIAETDKIIRIKSGHFREWLGKRGYPPQVVVTGMEDKLGATQSQLVFAPGTPVSSAIKERVIDLDMSHPGMVKLVN